MIRHFSSLFPRYFCSRLVYVTMMDDELGGYDDYDVSRIPIRTLFGVLDLHGWMGKDLGSVLGKGTVWLLNFVVTISITP